MARKHTTITITEGRDSGKQFSLTEWPASKTEQWILRAVFGLGKAGVEIPQEILQLGAAPTAYFIGMNAIKLPSRLGIRLANELMECVQKVEEKITRSLVENDIEDVSTRLKLKMEVLKLTFGFFGFVAPPNSEVPGNDTTSRKQ